MKERSILFIISFILFSCAGNGTKEGPIELSYANTRVVKASWYGRKFHGKRTASGDIFNMNAMTCAHKTLPFGTRLQVTNMSNNRSVKVIVNDRGPFVKGRELDLSYGAAKRIGLNKKGIGKVKIRHIGRNMKYKKKVRTVQASSSSGLYTVQIGSFKDQSNARRLLNALEYSYSDAYIMRFNLKGERFYRVRFGKYRSKNDALKRARKLAYEGYPILITAIE